MPRSLVAVLLLAAFSLFAGAPAALAAQVAISGGEADILAAPREGADLKTKAYQGEKYEVVNEAGDWLKIKLEDGSFGYVRRSSVTPAASSEEAQLVTIDEPGVPKEITNAKDGTVLAYVPAGEFWMGSPEGQGKEDEHPRHKVFLDGFYMAKTEVTQAQYRRFCQENKREMPEQNVQDDRCPVVNVTWDDAVAYCRWAGLRLPSEAEWEKAARGGAQTVYWWGEVGLHTMANFSGISGPDQWDEVGPVGSLPPNQYGIHDTAGNVWEWVSDFYDDAYYATSPAKNPTGPATGETRILRGGSWDGPADYMRPARRAFDVPDYTSTLLGFRCARGK